MPTKNFHLEFQKLAKKCMLLFCSILNIYIKNTPGGPIVTMKLGTQNLFLLNDPVVVRDLLEKKSSNYSCRPDIYARYFGDNLNIALREYVLLDN